MKVNTVTNLRFLASEALPKDKDRVISQKFVNDLSAADPLHLTSLFASYLEVEDAGKKVSHALRDYNQRIKERRDLDARHFWPIRIILRLFRAIFGAKSVQYDPVALHNLFLNTAKLMPDYVAPKKESMHPLTSGDLIIKQLKADRYDHLEAESHRLARFARKVSMHPPAVQVIMQRGLEAEEAFNTQGYYTVYHGQSLGNSFYYDVMRALSKLSKRPKNEVTLRTHLGLPTVDDFNEFKSSVIDRHGEDFKDDDHANRDLLAVSGSLEDTSPYESAAGFISRNANMTCNYYAQFHHLFELYGASPDVARYWALEATKIAYNKQRTGMAGALYVIAIPKELVDEHYEKRFIYLSQPYGKVKHSSKSKLLHKLATHAQEQYRLIIEPMMRHPEVKAMQITALPKAVVKEYKNHANEIASAIMACALGNA